MTNPETFQRLENLVNYGITKAFIAFVAANLLTGRLEEKDVIQYCDEVSARFENRKYARPRHLFSSVSSRRSNRHNQFWYK